MNLSVLFEDDTLLILDKPAGITVTSAPTEKGETVEDILASQFAIKAERSGIVHRLDKDTSGLLIVAKSDEVLLALQSQFKARTVKKQYQALVHGFIKVGGVVEGAIGRNPGNREKFTILEDEGKAASTAYQPLELRVMSSEVAGEIFQGFNKNQLRKLQIMRYPEFTLLSCSPLTGRTHQIRVHLKYLGHSIVGDGKYGGRKQSRLDHRWCPRQFLHAARIEFNHPKSGERLVFESSLPEDLKKALKLLEKVDFDRI